MVVLSEDGIVSSTDLLRTVPTLERKLTHGDAQTFLKSLVRDKWFKEQVSGATISFPALLPSLPVSRCTLSWPSFHFGIETILTRIVW